MLSLVPEALSNYKRLIDEGYAQDFGDALKTELRISGAANTAVRSADIESRREAIRRRGQTQKAGE
jgi:enoyl-CoA hydratase